MERSPARLTAVFVAVALAIVAIGAWFHFAQRDRVRSIAAQNLISVAKLKADQIAAWRQELLADARVLTQSPFLSDGIARFIHDASEADAKALAARFNSMRQNYHFQAMLLADDVYVVRHSSPPGVPALDPEEISACDAAHVTREPSLTELHRSSPGEKPHLNVVAPIFHDTGGGTGHFACIVIRVDPAQFLYPMVQAWPTPSATAETLLVRRDGDNAQFLNELRHRSDTALKLKIPLDRKEVPAVKAALGEEGFFEGNDYRGEKVASVIKHVTGSTWSIVAKVDEEEVYGEWRREAVLIWVAVGFALVFAYAMTRMLEERNAREHATELLASERKRRDADKRNAVTLMSIGDGVVVVDRDSRVELLNPVAEALTGWSDAEARGKPLKEVFNIINEYTRAPAKNPVDEVVARGVIVGLANHTLLIARDGYERPIADSAAPIRDDEGHLSGVVLVFRDQTPEHAAQKLLADSEARYRELFNAMMEGFALHEIVTDEEGIPVDYRFVAVNPAFCQMTGMVAAEVVGRRVLELMPDLEAGWIEKYGKVALTGETVDFIEYNAALDKQFRVFAYRPRERHFACLFRDVTDEINAKKAVERQIMALTRPVGDLSGVGFADLFNVEEIQRIQDTFADASGVASIITDTNGVGLTRPSNFTRFCSEIVRGTEKGLSNCFRSDGFLGRPNAEGPTIARCRSAGLWDAGAAIMIGDVHVANWLIGQVRDENQNEEDVRAYAREIGADEEKAVAAFREVPLMEAARFKKIAEALHTLAGQLSTMALVNVQQARFIAEIKRAGEEKNELQEKLHQAHKLESVGRLAGGVAHDFNNMLGVILGHAELALTNLGRTDPLFEDLQEIQKAAARSADITRQLLAFARKQAVSPRTLDINKQIDNSLKMLRRLIGEEIEMVWMPGQDLWKVKVDPTQLDQLLANLCTNARDAMGGAGRIAIETSNADVTDAYCLLHPDFLPGSFVVLTVSDTGKGIKQELLGKIFEPFFTTKDLGKGTGLGLSTVYGIAKQNGGFVNVYSEPEQGATFRVYLPRHAAKADEQGKQKASAVKGGTETVLIVEDEQGLLTLARRVLSSLGYRVFAANSVKEAMEIATEEAGALDILVTDVVMPGMNGRELAEKAKSLQPELKVLFMSGYTADVIAHHGLLEDGVNFIAKPFSVTELGIKVREVLDS